MPLKHIGLLILATAVWGFNFVAIKTGLKNVEPLTFSALRFFFSTFPLIFFIKRPKLPWKKLIFYGLFTYVGQFSLMFTALHGGFSAGLASLVLQMQAFFTIGLAVLFLHEKPLLFQILGTLVAACGVLVVALHTGGDVMAAGLVMLLLAAFSWASGNILTKSFGKIDMFGLVIWSSFVAFPPFLVMAYVFEGKEAVIHGINELQGLTLLALAYIVLLSTYFGYTLWNKMLAEYSAATVAPFTLLVPAFGMLSASFFLGEEYPLWKLGATVLIISGLALNQFGGKLQRWVRKRFS